MSKIPATALADFRAIDAQIKESAICYLSVAPDRDTPTSFKNLGEHAASLIREEKRLREIAFHLREIVTAVLRNFPENIFWDFDYLTSVLVAAALDNDSSDRKTLAATAEKIVILNDIFGENTRIRFRYVHDFLYGYDWAKWVKKSPRKNADIQPYDIPFLDYMIQRGRELFELIAANDSKYHKLRGTGHRNPFGFSREPDAEKRLFRQLAREGQIPLVAWEFNGAVEWQRPFAEIRKQQAISLGLGR